MSANRTIQPNISLPSHLSLPPIESRTTTNDIELKSITIENSNVIRLSIVFHIGTRDQSHPFTASSMFNMLCEGTTKYNSSEIAEKLDFYGIYYDTSVDRDYSIITVSCLKKFLPETLEILEECLLKPMFPEKEFKIYCNKRKEQLIIEREKPSYLARELFSKSLFGTEHPYGKTSKAENYDTLKTYHLKEFYYNYITSNNCFAVSSGDLDDNALSQIESLLNKLPLSNYKKNNKIYTPNTTLLATINRDEALQSSIRMGKIVCTKGDADFNGMQVLATILGGYFGSRLVKNLREEKGYTYGIYAAMITLEHNGYLAIATDVTANATHDAIEQIKLELYKLQNELVSQTELETIQNVIIGELMRLLDGPFGITDVVIDNIQSGYNADYLDEFLQDVKAITPLQINYLAKKYLDPNEFTTVIVGKIGG